MVMLNLKLIQEKEYVLTDISELVLTIPSYLKLPGSYRPIARFEIIEKTQMVLFQHKQLRLSELVNTHVKSFIHMQIEKLNHFDQLTEEQRAEVIDFIFQNAPNYTAKLCAQYYVQYLKDALI